MTSAVIITLCTLLLLSYIFDITTSKTKLPAVILLLILGWGMRQMVDVHLIEIPDLSPALPLLGTIGLILIVLEGSLELEFNRSRYPLIIKSSLVALLSVVVLSLVIGAAFFYFSHMPFKSCVINALPLAIISSAIAIPSSRNFPTEKREFVVYESSLSDIMGVLLFNFFIYNSTLGIGAVGIFFLQIIIIVLLSLIVTFGLLLLLRQLKHHVKYTPIVFIIVLVYAVSKELHFPSLLFILALGMIFANVEKFSHVDLIKKLQPEILKFEVHRFKELTIEMTFLIRSLFFLLFGFMIETSKLVKLDTLMWASGIIVVIYASRLILLRVFDVSPKLLLYVAPRGLITILLFLSIPEEHMLPLVNDSLIIQVVVFSALIMMFGMLGVRSSSSCEQKTGSPFK